MLGAFGSLNLPLNSSSSEADNFESQVAKGGAKSSRIAQTSSKETFKPEAWHQSSRKNSGNNPGYEEDSRKNATTLKHMHRQYQSQLNISSDKPQLIDNRHPKVIEETEYNKFESKK